MNKLQIIEKIILEKGFIKIKVNVSGKKKMIIDVFTASAILKFSDALSEINRNKFLSMSWSKMATLTWKLILGITWKSIK